MAYIRSANQSNFEPLNKPGNAIYHHGAESRRGYIPLAFQITSPYDKLRALLPHALIAHVNPSSFGESFNKKVERIQTRGGFVEQHWGDDLGEISADQSTGAFINLYTGLSSILRQRTIAWDRYRDLYDLYHNNGSVHDPFGNIVLQGHVMLMYDRGTYLGHFKNFSVEETDQAPFAFKLSWVFKVVETLFQMPINAGLTAPRVPQFQSQNQLNVTGSLQGMAGGEVIPGRTAADQRADEAAAQSNTRLTQEAQAIVQTQAPIGQRIEQGITSFGDTISQGINAAADFLQPPPTLPTKGPSPSGTPVK